jgi:hypothetical protein
MCQREPSHKAHNVLSRTQSYRSPSHPRWPLPTEIRQRRRCRWPVYDCGHPENRGHHRALASAASRQDSDRSSLSPSAVEIPLTQSLQIRILYNTAAAAYILWSFPESRGIAYTIPANRGPVIVSPGAPSFFHIAQISPPGAPPLYRYVRKPLIDGIRGC